MPRWDRSGRIRAKDEEEEKEEGEEEEEEDEEEMFPVAMLLRA